MALIFLKKVGIFSKMGASPKKSVQFLLGALNAAFPWGESWVYAPCAL